MERVEQYDTWGAHEICAATRTYLWMRRSALAGFRPERDHVFKSLAAGPLRNRGELTIVRLFRRVSSILQNENLVWLDGYFPLPEVVDSGLAATIREEVDAYEGRGRASKALIWLVNSLPRSAILNARDLLAQGVNFRYPDSTEFDVVIENGMRLSPKRLIGLAGLVYYNAPLLSDDFPGGKGTACFRAILNAGLAIKSKIPRNRPMGHQVDSTKIAESSSKLPEGCDQPARIPVTTTIFCRDRDISDFVKRRANGRCESCKNTAPFIRADGEPYLEIHHITPLAEGGPDTAENAVALCPNCHRECHFGSRAVTLRLQLSTPRTLR